MRVEFKLCWVAAVFVSAVTSSPANPAHDAHRVVNGQAVDLQPLIKWWTNRAGSRPLSGWPHVTGTVVGTNAWGWVVEANVEHTTRSDDSDLGFSSGGPGKVLLRNPPVQERAEFERLSAQLKELTRERSQIANQQTEAKSREDAINREQKADRRQGYRNRELAVEGRQVKQVEHQAQAQLSPIDKQIQDLKKKLSAYPSSDHYELDCFALDTGQQYSGMPVYDHGAVSR